jgi:hypothetical protein
VAARSGSAVPAFCFVRGTHGGTYSRDPEGTDALPAGVQPPPARASVGLATVSRTTFQRKCSCQDWNPGLSFRTRCAAMTRPVEWTRAGLTQLGWAGNRGHKSPADVRKRLKTNDHTWTRVPSAGVPSKFSWREMAPPAGGGGADSQPLRLPSRGPVPTTSQISDAPGPASSTESSRARSAVPYGSAARKL